MWLADDTLKSAYMVTHVAMSAAMFGELPSLAQTCAQWCSEITERMKTDN